MTHATRPQAAMTLYTEAGARKYLCASERERFYRALGVLDDPPDRTFCEMIYWTGCRPGEALAMSAASIDLEERVAIIRSLKKRGTMKGRHFRPVPLPDAFLESLVRVHGLGGTAAPDAPLWPFSRTTGWKRVRAVMEAADLSGVKACARGLRHAYGVHAAVSFVPESRIRTWLGHASLATTEIYLQMAAPEDRFLAERMWA